MRFDEFIAQLPRPPILLKDRFSMDELILMRATWNACVRTCAEACEKHVYGYDSRYQPLGKVKADFILKLLEPTAGTATIEYYREIELLGSHQIE